MSPKDTSGKYLISGKNSIHGLALQGAAAHGAYTWGVLERLCDSDIEIGAITATSSGVFNGILAANGLAVGDRQLAKATMRKGWEMMSQAAEDIPRSLGAPASPFRSWEIPFLTFGGLSKINFDKAVGTWPNLSNPTHMCFMGNQATIADTIYTGNVPNPIYDIVRELVDFEAVRNSEHLKFFTNTICAETLKQVIHTGSALTPEVIAAAANLPQMMPRAQIDGEEHWDGGFYCNPCFDPLASHCPEITDIKFISVNPVDQQEPPSSSARAGQFLDSLVFSGAALQGAFRIAALNEEIQKLRDIGLSESQIAKLGKKIIHIHRTQFHVPEHYGQSTKFNLDPDFLETLRSKGYNDESAELERNARHYGHRSTFDVRALVEPEIRGIQAMRSVPA